MKRLLICASASLAAMLAGCGTQPAGDATLPPLQLTDAAAQAQVAGAPAGGVSGFELRTTLPTGTPAPAPVWRLRRATSDDAAQVAGALGVPGRPTAVRGGWVSRYGEQRLVVRSDGSWTLGLDCSPGVPVQQENLDVMCASASGGGVAVAPASPGIRPGTRPSPPRLPPGPDGAQVRALAAPMLSRLGWSDAAIDVAVGAPTTSVTARRTFAGLPTADWTTTLDFTSPGKLTDGSGWVGTPDRGRVYPLIDASRAYRQLLAVPRAMPEMCALRKDGKPGCEPIPPTVITGASLGLALRHDLGRPMLVPAWLFAVAHSTEPLVVVAVDPRWLKPPATLVPRPLPPQSVNPAGPAVKPS